MLVKARLCDTLLTMVAILEMPAIRRQVSPFSVATYERMGEEVFGRRTELIRGAILEKMSISPLHAVLVTKLRRLILACLGVGFYCREEKPLKMKDSMPEPDIAVVSGREEDHFSTHPTTALLVIEVAVTSLELDREKANLYAEAAVPEYWIVLGETRTVEVYLAPEQGRYTRQRQYHRLETIQSAAFPALAVELAALFPGE